MSGAQKKSGDTPTLSALPRKRLAEQIAEMLRHKIILGDLLPGVAIHERETANALGVSRTPLREALFILESDGLVDMAPARTPTVTDPSYTDLTHMLEVQSALEALAGECACDVISDAELDEIEDIHKQLLVASEGTDPLEFFRIDMAFHTAIVAATRNAPLIRTHKQYHIRLWRVRYHASSKRLKRKLTLDDHGNIVNALRNRDKALTSQILRAHLRRAITNISIIFEEQSKDLHNAGRE